LDKVRIKTKKQKEFKLSTVIHRHAIGLAIVLLFAGCGAYMLGVSFGQSADDTPTEPLIVTYKSDADQQSLGSEYVKQHAVRTKEDTALNFTVVKVPAADKLQAIHDLTQDPRVLSVEPDYPVHGHATTPNDPEYANQTYWARTGVNQLWDRTKGDSSVLIADLDTGLNFQHPDFAGKTVPGYNFIANTTDATDDQGHGSAVAGVMAALSNNGTGIASGCWNCKIMPIKVLGSDNTGTVSNIASGIQYAVDHGAKVINISIGGPDISAYKTALDNAEAKGIIVISSAGNDGQQKVSYPAAYPNVIDVAATNLNDDVLWTSSNYDATVDIAAPGVSIETINYKGGYNYWSGTSFSSPIVASVAALLRSAFPQAAAAQIRSAIVSTADACCNSKISGGRLNAAKALAYMDNLYPPAQPVQGDLNGDNKVNLTDLSVLLSNYNTTNTVADINKSGKVDLTDLSILLGHWTG
jgi:subtilisin family serine protease